LEPEKKSVEEMLGEALRDIGILVIVFFPLDQWVTNRTITWKWAAGSAVVSAGALAAGIILERTRRR
jgi:hypothetical protein